MKTLVENGCKIDGWTLNSLEHKFNEIRENTIAKTEGNFIPEEKYWLRNLELIPFDKVKVVFVAEEPNKDPAHGCGIPYSSFPNVDRRYISKATSTLLSEYERDTGWPRPDTGDLSPWCKAGVLSIYLRPVRPNDGKDTDRLYPYYEYGWGYVYREILLRLSCERKNIVFVLFGKQARQKAIKHILHQDRHCIIKLADPAYRDTGAPRLIFEDRRRYKKLSVQQIPGSRIFSRINDYLKRNKVEPVDWRLPSSCRPSRKSSRSSRRKSGLAPIQRLIVRDKQ